MHLIFRKTCRVCGSKALTPVINLGEQYLQGSFYKPGKEIPSMRKIPLTLLRCDPTIDENACGLLQMEHTVPSEVLYSAYWYRSGTNKTMREHLKGIVNDAVLMLNKSSGSVLDIGCNDGTLLGFYSIRFTKYGVDPSDVAQEIDKNEATVIKDIFPSQQFINLVSQNKMDIITSIAMFYDLEDPIAFVNGIRNILSPEGIWIFEMSYMPMMLKNNSYDTICHEHLEFYSLAVIEYILKQCDMKVVNVALNDINGGSLRCYATHNANYKYANKKFTQNIQTMRQSEFDMELDTNKPYKEFQERISIQKDELVTLLTKLKKEGKKIHIYGASTKGNTILQWCGIDIKFIDCAAERNPDKYGASTLGTNIPIVSESESRNLIPDYYLVLPWHFRDEFIKREQDILEKGTKLIFPLPKVEIVTRENVAIK